MTYVRPSVGQKIAVQVFDLKECAKIQKIFNYFLALFCQHPFQTARTIQLHSKSAGFAFKKVVSASDGLAWLKPATQIHHHAKRKASI